MEALSGEIYKINKKFIDMTVFAGQGLNVDEKEEEKIDEKIEIKMEEKMKESMKEKPKEVSEG